MLTDALKNTIVWIAELFPQNWWLHDYLAIKTIIVVAVVCVICGSVGSLIVSNRMAFFSDALAHCAFAGVTLGLLVSLVRRPGNPNEWNYVIPLVMVSFGILVGLAIAWVKENSNLSSDTIIGVFFAAAVGFGAMLVQLLSRSTYISPETFMFGSPTFVLEAEIVVLIVLALLLAVALGFTFNGIVFSSFNPSLARSRGIPTRLSNYLLIVILALIVNLCLTAVGALLINALLIVPAATAVNFARSGRQVFWMGIFISVSAGLIGTWLGHTVEIPIGPGDTIKLSIAGTIVNLCVVAFFASLAYRILRDRRVPARAVDRPALPT